MLSNNAACTVRVTIFCTGSKFRPVSILWSYTKKRLSVTNLSLENKLPMFCWMLQITFSSSMQNPTEKPLQVYTLLLKPPVLMRSWVEQLFSHMEFIVFCHLQFFIQFSVACNTIRRTGQARVHVVRNRMSLWTGDEARRNLTDDVAKLSVVFLSRQTHVCVFVYNCF